MSQPCSLYIIESTWRLSGVDLLKVGISSDVGRRLAALQTASPFRLSVAETVTFPTRRMAAVVERRMHEECGIFRLSGEWFTAPLVGILCTLDSVVARYWFEDLAGEVSGLADWFGQIGLNRASAADVIASEGWA